MLFTPKKLMVGQIPWIYDAFNLLPCGCARREKRKLKKEINFIAFFGKGRLSTLPSLGVSMFGYSVTQKTPPH